MQTTAVVPPQSGVASLSLTGLALEGSQREHSCLAGNHISVKHVIETVMGALFAPLKYSAIETTYLEQRTATNKVIHKVRLLEIGQSVMFSKMAGQCLFPMFEGRCLKVKHVMKLAAIGASPMSICETASS